MSDDLAFTPATELIALYRAKRLSPVEATQAALDRIAAHNERLNAFCLVNDEGAMVAARASEARWQRGEPKGLVDGVPVSIKDLVLTRYWPTLRGSKTIDAGQAWDEDAPCVARLGEHGAVVLGKTTTCEFGWKGVTDSPLSGITRNPWNLERTPGGSSGGSAAAVAAGMGPLAIGTDGGGSVRIPSGFTGLAGLKPTYGRVPLYPPSPFGGLSHVGPIARTVADAALMLSVIARPDARDPYALVSHARDWGDGLGDGVEGLRVAVSADLGYVRVDPEIAALVAAAADTFAGLGAKVEAVDPGFATPQECFRTLWYAGAAHALRAVSASRRELMDPGLVEVATEGARLGALDLLAAESARAALGVHMGAFHQRFDLLLTPTLPIPAFAAGEEVPPGSGLSRWPEWTPFSYPFNLTGQPAVSVPCGFTADGLPAGLQIVGPRHADALVLRAAHAYQTAAPTLDRRPPL
ncbi:MAG: amidase [Proteobacteria bacterium]|nr:amidase [Pseudomonadota bacterium]